METKITVVTACNKVQWVSYGRCMAESFLTYWPSIARLVVYGDEHFFTPGRVEWRAMPEWFLNWKALLADNAGAHGRATGAYKFRRDCVKFAHKIAALTDVAQGCRDGLLIWTDIDTNTDHRVTADWLCSLFPDNGSYMAWLDRKKTYPECGFMMFKPQHPVHDRFMGALKTTYETNVVLCMRETHDSYVIQQLALDMVARGAMSMPHSLSGRHADKHHPFALGPLGERMDHMKGDRKHVGASPERRHRA